MSRRRRSKRGVSLGTVVMLLLTIVVLGGFCALLPRLTGVTDVRTNAAELAVAIDQSLSQIAASGASLVGPTPKASVLPPSDLATATPTPAAPTDPPEQRFSLCAAGSIQINSNVQKALTDDDTYRFDILFDDLTGDLSADLSIATLENNVIPSAKLSDSNIPTDVLAPLRETGVNALCLGYYGALNGGISGLVETQQAVSAAGMTPYGVYASQQERDSLTLLDVNGICVALLSYQNELTSSGKRQTTDEEQAYAIAAQQLPVITADIAKARQAGAKVIVVSLCWGKVGATSPTSTQKELAQGIADAGADIILGTHPGTLQTVEILTAERGDGKYHPVLCAYSLGNLFTYDREKRTTLASILLKSDVVYDPVTGCVAFDNLSYTPTYSWRGKEDDVTRYRVILNDGKTYPDYVDDTQRGVMERCFTLVNDVMEGTPVSPAQ
ncbi:MAG: CapA family protein [Clostridiales bacterium]|nr:CapA family protein [Clostridiales bacterium]